ncbi:MAG: topoisomerase DNA-binding C4 zinc finger domain-containing protein [Coriobacteriia bacterium]
MARRDDGILDMIFELPWWIGAIFAGVTYLVMRFVLPGVLDGGGSISSSLAELPRMLALPVAGVVLLVAMMSGLRSLIARARGGAQGSSTPSSARPCPRCGADLVIRRASRGANAGSNFWGCSSYPKCRYTEDIIR